MKKAINKKQNMFTLAFSALGAILGFTLLLITLQLFTDVDTIFNNESDAIDSEYLVLKEACFNPKHNWAFKQYNL